jgi:hypothetical protein
VVQLEHKTDGLDFATTLGISPDGDSIYAGSTLDNAIVQLRRK